MGVMEALDREELIERAEAVRFWLLNIALSRRTAEPIQRELGAIIAGDFGRGARGPHPLAGLTIADFIVELHSRDGGAVGQLKALSDAALRELRGAIPLPPSAGRVAPFAAADRSRTVATAVSVAVAPIAIAQVPPGVAAEALPDPGPRGASAPAAAAQALPDPGPLGAAPEPVTASASAPSAPRRAGRPQGSTRAARNGAAPAGDVPAAVRPVAAPREVAPTLSEADLTLDQIKRQWPALHPHARRAIVLFASTLLVEAMHEGRGA